MQTELREIEKFFIYEGHDAAERPEFQNLLINRITHLEAL